MISQDKPLLIVALLWLVLSSCSNPKNDQASTLVDSTQQIGDTLQAQDVSAELQTTAIVEEPFSGRTQNFPALVVDAPAHDSLETEINDNIGKLLQAYDTIEYLRISSNYSWTQAVTTHGQEGDDTYVVNETREESCLWLFDRSLQLRGFTREVKYDDAYGNGTESTTYLFSNDSLIAVSERAVDSYEVEEIKVVRMMASSSANVGFRRQAQYENVTINYLAKEDLSSSQREFFASFPELINTLKAGKRKATEDDIYFELTVSRTREANPDRQAKAVTYPVTFNVEKDLYTKYILKQ